MSENKNAVEGRNGWSSPTHDEVSVYSLSGWGRKLRADLSGEWDEIAYTNENYGADDDRRVRVTLVFHDGRKEVVGRGRTQALAREAAVEQVDDADLAHRILKWRAK